MSTTKKIVVAVIVLILILLAYYGFAMQWSEYSDWGAMRYVDRSGNRPVTDPLYNATGIMVNKQPKVQPGQTVQIESTDGLVKGRFVVIDVVQEMRPGKPAVWWIATDATWGHAGVFDRTANGGKFRII